MKTLYPTLSKILFVICLLAMTEKSDAQLAAGDIAFTGYHSTASDSDRFSFVALVNIPIGTVINFTDNAWGNNPAFRTGEQTLTLTTTVSIVTGREVTVAGLPAGVAPAAVIATVYKGGSAGTLTGTMPSLSATGDEVFAYQGSTASPTFISGILMNVYTTLIGDPTSTTAATWDNLPVASLNTNASFKPATLTTGTNAIWIGTQDVTSSERNNARFSCSLAASGGANLNTAAGIRAAVNNQAYWTTESVSSGTAPSFSLPSGCNFFNLLPLRLISFKAKNNISDIELSWQSATQVEVSHFEVERSYNGTSYSYIATVAATNSSSGDYSYADADALKSGNENIFYRLKIVDKDRNFQYSPVAGVKNMNNTDAEIANLVNPVKNDITFSYISKQGGAVTAQLINMNGAVVFSKNYTVTRGTTVIMLDNSSKLNSGTYILKLTGVSGVTTVKVVKQ